MQYIANTLRKYTTTYVLFVILSTFISEKTLAEPVSITIDDCRKIYAYLKNIHVDIRKEDHPVELVKHIHHVSKNIFIKKRHKQKAITLKELQNIFSNTDTPPSLPTGTVLPYRHMGYTWTYTAKRNTTKKCILTLNFFLEILQKTEEEGCAKMHMALNLFMRTPHLQRFITQIKAECMTHTSIASTPSVEQGHPQVDTGDSQYGNTSENNPQHAHRPDQQQENFITSPAYSIPATLNMEQDHTNTSSPTIACTEKTTETQPLRLDLSSTAEKYASLKTTTKELSQQIGAYDKEQHEKTLNQNKSNENNCFFGDIPKSLAEDISILDIGYQNENKIPVSCPESKCTPPQSADTPTRKHKENTHRDDFIKQHYTVEATKPDKTDNNISSHPCYKISIHSHDDKKSFRIMTTEVKLANTKNDIDRTELDFFFAPHQPQPEPEKNHYSQLRTLLPKMTYIQKTAVFAKCDDQNTETAFIVRIKKDGQCLKEIMHTCINRNSHPEGRVQCSSIIPVRCTTTHLKTQNTETSQLPQHVHTLEPHSKLNKQFLINKYTVICTATENDLRNQFTIPPYSADRDTAYQNTHTEKLFDSHKNYLSIAQMTCTRTSCNNQTNNSDYSCPNKNDDDDMDYTKTTNQDIIDTDFITTADQYKIDDKDTDVNCKTTVNILEPLINIIYFLPLNANNQQDVKDAMRFLYENSEK
ncbi:MAG: hypothetical protein QS748_11835 [Candidatus Endonucleobacter bathymodioli]|uniref:Uncharacterized protein n=1 Tax=Candidatus Endonucleibacter bathymodioli TaxID=539814 RepID=A0AA90NXT1_9GAMM|nr:hypothetical protein [Candidatus Endonucleobacter bathymodioli]